MSRETGSQGAGLILALILGCCSEEPESPPPAAAGSREVVHLIDRPADVVAVHGPLTSLALPQPITRELTARGTAGQAPWRAELPWPAESAAGIFSVHAGGRALAPCAVETLRAAGKGFAFLPARRLHDAADIPENPVEEHNPRRRRPSVHEYGQILFHDGSSVSEPLEATAERAVFRLRVRRGDVEHCTLECTVGDGPLRTFDLAEGEWQVLEWEEPLAPGPTALRVTATAAEGHGMPKRIVATLQWLEVEFPGPDLLLLPEAPGPLSVSYLPRFPGKQEMLRPASGAPGERWLLHCGGPLELSVPASVPWLEVDGVRGSGPAPGQPVVLEPAPGLIAVRVPGDLELTAEMPWAPLLTYLADADGRLRDDLCEEVVEEHGLLDRMLRRISCGGDRRTAFFLPTPSTLEIGVDTGAGDRLRLALGVADPPGEAAASSSRGAEPREDASLVRLRVGWRGPDGALETVAEASAAAGSWKDVEVPLPPGKGTLCFEVEGSAAGTVPAALADPRLVPPPGQRAPRPNLLVYLIDTLRADALSCYGAGNPTSPAIDAFAAHHYLFENFYAVASWTRPTTATLFTGVYPSQHGITREDRALPTDLVTLAEVLRHAGYSTWGALSNIQVSAPGVHFEQGFHRFVTPEALGILDSQLQADPSSRRLADCMTPWLRANGDEPFFLYLHSMDPHIPYLPPAPYAGRFSGEYHGPLQGVPLVSPLDFWSRKDALGPPDFAYVKAVYEEEVRAQDDAIGELLALLEQEGLLDNTLIVLLADHGEEFYEHGRWTHAGRMWEELIHVPLVLAIPPGLAAGLLPAPQRFAAPVSQADVLPTVLELLGIPDPAARQGRSFLDVLRGTRQEDEVLYSLESERLGALRAGPLKLLWDDPESAEPGSTPPHLYHLGQDPGEAHDLAKEHPETVAELLSRRRQIEEELRGRGGQAPDPAGVQFGESDLERLRQLGYLLDTDPEEQDPEPPDAADGSPR